MSVEIVAEIGINHHGHLSEALDLMTMAKGAGCDVCKFQTRNPRLSVPKSQWDIRKKTPFWAGEGTEEMSYIDYKERMEIPHLKYSEIDKHAKQLNIAWSTSFWDVETLEKITSWYRLPWLKIPSCCCTDLELIELACKICLKQNCGLYISTGMSTEVEIDTTFNLVENTLGDRTLELLTLFHCHSAYPSPLSEINLPCIKTLKNKYGCRVGYSGHETQILPAVASVCFGAEVVEKHIVLKDVGGTDDKSSLRNIGLCKLVRGIRDLEQAVGDGVIRFYESEQYFKDKLRK